MIRPQARGINPTRADHLLIYVSPPDEYTEPLHRLLLQLDVPARVYGTSRTGRDAKIEFKPISNVPFLEDLASCRSVIATAGNQLPGEAIYFGKPVLGFWNKYFEQKLNGMQINRLGVGMGVPRSQLSSAVVKSFLAREDEFTENARSLRIDGAADAVQLLERLSLELTTRKSRGAPTP